MSGDYLLMAALFGCMTLSPSAELLDGLGGWPRPPGANASGLCRECSRNCLSNCITSTPEVNLSSPQAKTMSSTRRHAAALTITRNEGFFLPIWLRYYRRHFSDEDIYVIDNCSDDGSTEGLPVHVHRTPKSNYFHHYFLLRTVIEFMQALLKRYACVLFTEVDELVVPNPAFFSGGLRQYVAGFRGPAVRAIGRNLWHNFPTEPTLNSSLPIMTQRTLWCPDKMYDKPVLTKKVLHYGVGFHYAREPCPMDRRLFLVHLRMVDRDNLVVRQAMKLRQKFQKEKRLLGLQQHYSLERILEWYQEEGRKASKIPSAFRNPPVF
eukprot:RCo030061